MPTHNNPDDLSRALAPTHKSRFQQLPTGKRLRALDGLRGLAAVVVLLHHALLLVPELAANYYVENTQSDAGKIGWWLTYTPLHLVWEGTAAVYVFFILSGLVLALPILRDPGFSWKAYFPHRILRLYLPVWGAIAFALLSFTLVPRLGEMPSAWLDARTREATMTALVRDATLVFGAGGLASPLWSLRWEVIFSLLLPAFVWLGRKGAKLTIAGVSLCLAVICMGGFFDRDFLRYMPMFMIGVLLATGISGISTLRDKIEDHRLGRVIWVAFGLCGLLLFSSRWTAKLFDAPDQLLDATIGPTTAGALALTLTAAFCRPVSKVLELSLFQRLGTLSFSLYLVHEPIIIAFGYFLGPSYIAAAVVLSIPVALLTAQLFYYSVERPSHRLAKWVQARMAATARRSEPTEGGPHDKDRHDEVAR